jgi:hypothetical protein
MSRRWLIPLLVSFGSWVLMVASVGELWHDLIGSLFKPGHPFFHLEVVETKKVIVLLCIPSSSGSCGKMT